MQIIYFMIAISFLVAVLFLIFFIWAVNNGQFEDQESPAHRILFDDNKTTINKHSES